MYPDAVVTLVEAIQQDRPPPQAPSKIDNQFIRENMNVNVPPPPPPPEFCQQYYSIHAMYMSPYVYSCAYAREQREIKSVIQ